MSTAAIHFDAQTHPAIAEDFHASDFAGNDDNAPPVEHLPESCVSAVPMEAMTQTPTPPVPAELDGLPERMQLLARIAGSAAAIAKRCGFSEGAVRGWCHGRSDMSRERCAIIARTLGISLRWLITGAGPMREENNSFFLEPTPQHAPHPPPEGGKSSTTVNAHVSEVDPNLLGAAFRVLQSYIVLVGGSLNPMQRADAVAQIYQVLTHTGGTGHADRLIALHATLSSYFCSRKSQLIG